MWTLTVFCLRVKESVRNVTSCFKILSPFFLFSSFSLFFHRMPAYNANVGFAIFFILYILINTYIFMSVFLAVVYNNYKKYLKVKLLGCQDSYLHVLQFMFRLFLLLLLFFLFFSPWFALLKKKTSLALALIVLWFLFLHLLVFWSFTFQKCKERLPYKLCACTFFSKTIQNTSFFILKSFLCPNVWALIAQIVKGINAKEILS